MKLFLQIRNCFPHDYCQRRDINNEDDYFGIMNDYITTRHWHWTSQQELDDLKTCSMIETDKLYLHLPEQRARLIMLLRGMGVHDKNTLSAIEQTPREGFTLKLCINMPMIMFPCPSAMVRPLASLSLSLS